MLGLGKQRTSFGKYIDKHGIKQSGLPVNKNTATRLCNELSYEPPAEIQTTAIGYLRRKGHDVRPGDFW